MNRLLVLAALALTACATAPGTAPPTAPPTALQTFTQIYAAAVQSDDLAVATATNALNAGLINSTQAAKIQSITIAVKGVLDAAQAAFTADNSIAANANISQATVTLVGLSLCLTTKPLTIATFDTCIQPISTPAVSP